MGYTAQALTLWVRSAFSEISRDDAVGADAIAQHVQRAVTAGGAVMQNGEVRAAPYPDAAALSAFNCVLPWVS